MTAGMVRGLTGAVPFDPNLRRRKCAAYRCPVRIPITKASRYCYGHERVPLSRGGGHGRPTMHDPERGMLMLCRPCDEWWPMDSEFWYEEPLRPGVYQCRACRAVHRGVTA